MSPAGEVIVPYKARGACGEVQVPTYSFTGSALCCIGQHRHTQTTDCSAGRVSGCSTLSKVEFIRKRQAMGCCTGRSAMDQSTPPTTRILGAFEFVRLHG